jgi:uncharacterized protein (DUF58 family)
MSEAGRLFDDPDSLRWLARLDMLARQVISGARRGEHRSRRRGAGTVFSDHRSYSRGDDLRYVDWNVFGRLGALFVKEFEVEESANVLLLLDRSLSMDFGEPAKLLYAKRIAGALGFIGLCHMDRVEVLPLPSGEPRAFTGRRQVPALFEHLLSLEAKGGTDLLSGVRAYLPRLRQRGVAVLLSDLCDPGGFRPALEFLRHRRHRVFVVQVVAPWELKPEISGNLRLVDCEDGTRLDVRMTDDLLRAYREAFRRLCASVAGYALRHGVGHARLRTDRPVSEAVLSLLRRGGVVR